MVHPVGFAGYGFQAAESVAKRRGHRVGIITKLLLGHLLFWVREPQCEFEKGIVNRS